MEIQDIFTEFQDGVKLINLYEQISGFEFEKYNKKPVHKVQCIENLRQVLLKIQDFIESIGIKLQYGAEQLYEGDRRQILGMLWVLISKFVIAAGAEEDEETKSLKQELLAWCQENTKEYDNVEITNFTTSWQNGLALNALIHHFLPEKVDFYSLEPENKLENIILATQTAESIGIDNVLDAEELANSDHVNERSVMTQVAIYRTHLKSYADKVKYEKLEKQIAAFTNNSRELASALQDRISQFENTDVSGYTHVQSQEALEEFYQYKESRSELSNKKTALDIEFLQLKRDRAKAKVEPYVPSEGELTPEAIGQLFSELSTSERSYYNRLQERIASFLPQVDSYDSAATEFINSVYSKIESEDTENGESIVEWINSEAENIFSQFSALQEDKLDRLASVDISRVQQAQAFGVFAISGETNDVISNIVQ